MANLHVQRKKRNAAWIWIVIILIIIAAVYVYFNYYKKKGTPVSGSTFNEQQIETGQSFSALHLVATPALT